MNNKKLALDVKKLLLTDNLDFCSKKVRGEYLNLISGKLTKEENPISHLCVYFWPYNPQSNKVFLGHHIKSGLWLAPGGHVNNGEGLSETVKREVKEELNIEIENIPNPFLLTVTKIIRDPRQCRFHFDVWHAIPLEDNNLQGDPKEFYQTKWFSPKKARKLIKDPNTLKALEKIEQLMS